MRPPQIDRGSTVAGATPIRHSEIHVRLREGSSILGTSAVVNDADTFMLQPVAIEPGEKMSKTRGERSVRPASRNRGS